MKIHRKLILTYILLAILPTFLLCTYLINSIKTLTVNQTLNDATRSVEIIESEFHRSLNMLTDVSGQLYLNKSYLQLIEKQYTTTWDTVSAYFLFKDFEDLRKIYGNHIDNIRIYVRNDTILESWYLNKITAAEMESEWYGLARVNPTRVVWLPTVNDNTFTGGKDCYSLIRLVENPNMQSILIIDLNQARINSLLQTNYSSTTIFDEAGNVICSNDTERAEQIAQRYSFASYAFGDSVRILDDKSDGGEYKIVMKDIRAGGVNGRFRIVSSFLLEDILHESNTILIRYIITTVFLLLVTSVLAFYATRGLKRRVMVLCNEMELVSKGDFALVSTVTGKDEIGVLSKSLNVMAKNLNELIAENYETNFQKQELLLKHNDIKLKLLTNQMNPHFLFNTLESLRMEACMRSEMDISDVIQKLGELLRKSFQTGNEEIPLQDELRMVEDYLCIQAFRYGSRIQYRLSVSDDASRLMLLPFLIQPIVENAIIHGLENSKQAGVININAFCDDSTLTVEVVDTGIGMTPERLQEIRDSMDVDNTDDSHIGIRNVHLRIKLRYGAQYGLSIESGENTRVVIRVPKVVKRDV